MRRALVLGGPGRAVALGGLQTRRQRSNCCSHFLQQAFKVQYLIAQFRVRVFEKRDFALDVLELRLRHGRVSAMLRIHDNP